MRLSFWRRHPWLTATVFFLFALIVGFVFAFPAAMAAVCPQCFGLRRLERAVYVQRSMTESERMAAADVIRKAREHIRAFYGEQRGRATILICATDRCYQRLRGGGSRGVAIYDRILILSPRGIDEVIATHELAHIELHRRVGAWKVYRGAVPTWFDEGLAVVVSDDPRYLAPQGTRGRCLVRSDKPLPDTLHQWLGAAAGNDRIYAAAACRVNQWLTAHGGPPSAARLAQRLADGASFDDAVR